MTMYQLINDQITDSVTCIKRLSDNAFIPFDPANTCYQTYLDWLSEGNEPLPADEPATDNEQLSP
jgi:hypothetical protein